MLEESRRHRHPCTCCALKPSLGQTFAAQVRISQGGRDRACNMGSHQLGDTAQGSTASICWAALEHLVRKTLRNLQGLGRRNSVSTATKDDWTHHKSSRISSSNLLPALPFSFQQNQIVICPVPNLTQFYSSFCEFLSHSSNSYDPKWQHIKCFPEVQTDEICISYSDLLAHQRSLVWHDLPLVNTCCLWSHFLLTSVS